MDNNEKRSKEKEDIAEVIRKKLEVHKRQESFDYYEDKVKPLQESTKTTVKHYHSSEHHPVFFTRRIRKRSKVLSVIIILFFLVIVSVVSLILYFAFIKSTQRELDARFGKVVIDNEEIANLIINDDVYLGELRSISVVFGDGNSEYLYNPGYIDKYYQVSSHDLRLEDFKKITYVSLFFEYNSERKETDVPVQITAQNVAVSSISLGEAGPFVRFWVWVKGYF